MNYVDKIVRNIQEELGCEFAIARFYALLVLLDGDACLNADVHDAWAVYADFAYPGDPDLMPYNSLSPERQEAYSEIKDKLRKVSKEFRQQGTIQ